MLFLIFLRPRLKSQWYHMIPIICSIMFKSEGAEFGFQHIVWNDYEQHYHHLHHHHWSSSSSSSSFPHLPPPPVNLIFHGRPPLFLAGRMQKMKTWPTSGFLEPSSCVATGSFAMECCHGCGGWADVGNKWLRGLLIAYEGLFGQEIREILRVDWDGDVMRPVSLMHWSIMRLRCWLKWWGCIGVFSGFSPVSIAWISLSPFFFIPTLVSHTYIVHPDDLVSNIAGAWISDRVGANGLSKPSSDEHEFRFVGLNSSWNLEGTIYSLYSQVNWCKHGLNICEFVV